MIPAGTKVFFCDHKGVHEGYVEKQNKFTFNVLENDNSQKEGYQLWRINEYFLTNTPQTAREQWSIYRNKLREFKKMLTIRRKLYEFRRGITVLVQPIDKAPYEGMVLKVNKICLDIQKENGGFMKVDKFICTPQTII